jgi:hypothetical protein
MKLPQLSPIVWMCLPVMLLLGGSVLLLLPTAAMAADKPAADAGCRAAAVQVIVDDPTKPLDPADPHFAAKLAARYEAIGRR